MKKSLNRIKLIGVIIVLVVIIFIAGLSLFFLFDKDNDKDDGTSSVATWIEYASTELMGEGTEEEPYLIQSAADLAYIALETYSGNTFDSFYFKQTCNLNLRDHEWLPIGYNGTFDGYFDGNGYSILNLTTSGILSEEEEDYYKGGLFCTARYIKNVFLYNADIRIISDTVEVLGGIVGHASEGVENCHFNGLIVYGDGSYGEEYFASRICIGGIAGEVYSVYDNVIRRCSSSGEIVINKTVRDNATVGGLFGSCAATSTMTECKSTIKITCKQGNEDPYDYNKIGGLCGGASIDEIESCYFSGIFDIFCGDVYNIGGLVSDLSVYSSSNCEINNSYNAGYLNSYQFSDLRFAGIVYSCPNDTFIERCFVTTNNHDYIYTNSNSLSYFSIANEQYAILNSCEVAEEYMFYDDHFWLEYMQKDYRTPLPRLDWEFNTDMIRVGRYKAVISYGSFEEEPEGSGSEENPYLIATPGNLLWISRRGGSNGYCVQTADIDMYEYEWSPISDFQGEYNGNGYSILNIMASSSYNSSTFGGLFERAYRVKNVNLINVEIVSDANNIGGIIGEVSNHNGSYVMNCNFDGLIRSRADNIGGIVGYTNSESKIIACSSTGLIYNDPSNSLGGIVGYTDGRVFVQACSSNMKIIGASGSSVGGIIGSSRDSVIKDCYFYGVIYGDYFSASGIANVEYSESISSCYSAGIIDNFIYDSSGYIAGISLVFGDLYQVEGCFVTGFISYEEDSYYILTNDGDIEPDSFYCLYYIGNENCEYPGEFCGELGYNILSEYSQAWDVDFTQYSAFPKHDKEYLQALMDFDLEGNGYSEYYVYDFDDLLTLSRYVEAGNSFEDYTIIQQADIEFSTTQSWAPIGTRTSPFKGTYDNGGYIISGLGKANIDTGNDCIGLFGVVVDADIRVEIQDSDIEKGKNVGLVVGYAETSEIYGVVKDSDIDLRESGSIAGAVVGYANNCDINGEIEDCYINAYNFAGGVVGVADACEVYGSFVKGTYVDGQYSGGIVASISLLNSRGEDLSFCDVEGCIISGTYSGGIVADTSVAIYNCNVKNSEVIGMGLAGGIVAIASNNISHCYNYAQIRSFSYDDDKDCIAGGIVGRFDGGDFAVIEDCFNYGTVNISDIANCIGGIVGVMNGGTLLQCYNLANVGNINLTATDGGVGGLVGKSENYASKISNCHCNAVICGKSDGIALGGLIGKNKTGIVIDKCTFNGTLYTGSQGYYVGGMIGFNEVSSGSTGSISNTSIYATIHSSMTHVFQPGIFVGYHDAIDFDFTNCAFVGSILSTSQSSNFGAVCKQSLTLSACYAVTGTNKYYTKGDWSAWTPTNNLNNGYPMQNALYAVAIGGYSSDEVVAILKSKGFTQV